MLATSITFGALCLHLLILALSPLVMLTVHSVLARILARSHASKSNQSVCLLAVLLSALPVSVLLVLFGLFGSITETLPPTLIYSILVYLALGYTYFHLFNMSETARRIRLLYEIESGLYDPARGTGQAEATSIATRIERLEGLGQVELRTGRYFLKGRSMHFAARVVRLWGLLLGIDILSR